LHPQSQLQWFKAVSCSLIVNTEKLLLYSILSFYCIDTIENEEKIWFMFYDDFFSARDKKRFFRVLSLESRLDISNQFCYISRKSLLWKERKKKICDFYMIHCFFQDEDGIKIPIKEYFFYWKNTVYMESPALKFEKKMKKEYRLK
jgi:hypothetical protein